MGSSGGGSSGDGGDGGRCSPQSQNGLALQTGLILRSACRIHYLLSNLLGGRGGGVVSMKR